MIPAKPVASSVAFATDLGVFRMLCLPVAGHVRRCATLFGLLLAGCALAGMVNAWSFLLGLFALFLGLPTLALLFVTLGLWLSWEGLRCATSSRMWERVLVVAVAPAMMLGVALVSLHAVRAGNHAGWLIRLVCSEADYARRIAGAEQRLSERRRVCGLERGASRCSSLDRPLRMAFDGEGFLNNWSSVVYDPTGDVVRPGAIDREEALDSFGGTLLGCEALYRDFYLCSFA